MDELFYSRVRLAIVAALLRAEWTSFTDLQSVTGVTRGNLAAHLGKLLLSGVINEEKRISNRRPLTRYRLTARGRNAFRKHMEHLQGLFEAVQREYGDPRTGAPLTPPRTAREATKA